MTALAEQRPALAPSGGPAPTRPSVWARLTRIDKVGVAFVLPSAVAVLGLLIYPVLSSVYYSLTDQNLLRPSHDLVWLENFRQLVTSDAFWNAFATSIRWTAASIVGQLAVGMVLALCLDKVRRLQGLYRVLLIVPWAFPPIVIAFGWKWILNDVYGVLPNLLTRLGLTDSNVSLLANPTTVFWTVLAINVWFGAPLFMVNILSALKTIPREQYEAATMDGANAWQQFSFITLRNIRNVIGLLVILRTIWVFNNFDLLFLLTGGGPGEMTTTLPIFAYRTGWGLHQLGMASAVTVLLLVFLLVASRVAFAVLSRWEKEDR
ncbi:binding-protein-dependent transport systems inner membrane component [Beutenbergia cavernae DSM 12333]|uniref:Binding-protein-dependent transport systems inner membrane component n=1 Tax=Beutenbergia cavernae (strain ATCC BAA-8 / DSM 12333 / CCUG 43141 / JCM 11478 / NBRC 16432 / NCIMB 13614 / HKI 0122) TaxID=471853 RepID=C5C3V7_BEUC1|nr:sugar ABC transporter permease [Beutenbergia cavernae]ACQ82016.1 binding-protein-dependent transport systems inner membrane component [Beutenbergia cavernae DSM 12333]